MKKAKIFFAAMFVLLQSPALGVVRYVLIVSAMLMLAGRIDYWQAWVYGGVALAFVYAMWVLCFRKADLFEERVKPGPGRKWWDRAFLGLYVPSLLVVHVVASLDAGRFQWSPRLPLGVYLGGYLVLVLAYSLTWWSMWSNCFFSSVVRIQTDRGHQVVKDGPYRIFRHPGYVAAILRTISTAMVLGSVLALIPAGVIVLLFIVQTAPEDATLRKELPGYAEYARKVRYRLLPGVW